MHGQRTPSPPTSRQYYPATPSAPYMYTQPLPPSPHTPSSRSLPGAITMPRAPHMRTVDLPPQPPSCASHLLPPNLATDSYPPITDGLPTPPSSPEKSRSSGQLTLAPELMYGYATPVLLFNQPQYNPQHAQQPATNPPISVIYIHFEHRTFMIQGRSGCVTVADVFQQLHAAWVRFRNQDEPRGTRAYTRDGNTTGDMFADRGIHFGGLTPSRARPGHFDLHLRH